MTQQLSKQCRSDVARPQAHARRLLDLPMPQSHKQAAARPKYTQAWLLAHCPVGRSAQCNAFLSECSGWRIFARCTGTTASVAAASWVWLREAVGRFAADFRYASRMLCESLRPHGPATRMTQHESYRFNAARTQAGSNHACDPHTCSLAATSTPWCRQKSHRHGCWEGAAHCSLGLGACSCLQLCWVSNRLPVSSGLLECGAPLPSPCVAALRSASYCLMDLAATTFSQSAQPHLQQLAALRGGPPHIWPRYAMQHAGERK